MAPIIEPADRPERRDYADEDSPEPAQASRDARQSPPIEWLMLFDD